MDDGWRTIYERDSHFISFFRLVGSCLIIFFDTLLRWAGVLYRGRLSLLSGLLSSSVEKASDVADSQCIQSQRLQFPIKTYGTLPWRRVRANYCHPCG